MKNQMKVILLCVFINVTVICLIIIGYCFFNVDNIRMNMKIYDYSTYKTNILEDTTLNTKLILFPDKISRKEVVDIQYIKEKKKNSYFLYLVMEYDKDTYQKEKKRLLKINNILKEELSNPTYITILDKDKTYEYAILEEKTTKIIYVYNHLEDWSNTKIDKKYILDNNIDKSLMEYNLYIDNDS